MKLSVGQFLLWHECFTKKISSSSFELVSVQSKMGVMDFFCLNKKSSNASLKCHFKFVFLISSIFTLDLVQISICISCKGFPSHNEKKAHKHTLSDPLPLPQQIKCL
ncbi:hypothetical protein GOODEAATRI_012577 [Goodea atripinnis]|uniref:Uncharacterized protein n=1 Tax=Goodea atripinnis TaxID=208336 RepID=A0ABV0NJM7_9TELE